MKFMVAYRINAESRADVEGIVKNLGVEIEGLSIQTLGPEDKKDLYVPNLTVIKRERGWCLQLDGEDQVIGISTDSEEKDFLLRRDAAVEVAGANNLIEHRALVKNFFLLILQLNLGEYDYFSEYDDVERMKALVAFSLQNPLIVISKEHREEALSGDYSDNIPPKDLMN